MSKIRVMIVDDHRVVREGLERVIEQEPDMRAVGLAADGEQALAIAVEHAPHVAVVDMRMPRLGGVPLIRQLRERHPALRLLVLSMYEEERYRRAALGAGAAGYLSKRTSASDLLHAIRHVHGHGPLEALDINQGGTASPSTQAERDVLSTREREIVALLAQGHTQRAIADTLGISKSSVETYRARVFRKLGVDTRVELLARVSGGNLMPPSTDRD